MRRKLFIPVLQLSVLAATVTGQPQEATNARPAASPPRRESHEPPPPASGPEAVLREPRERPRASIAEATDLPALREELRNLPPEERQARIRQWREQKAARRLEFRFARPEERVAKRKELRQRFDRQLGELRSKQASGTLNLEEKRRLQRMEELVARRPHSEAQP